ncbi:protein DETOXIFICATION 27 isoform X4 [Prunus yedoensis var. nudiflora]|uniref:Protein DETOXIFICATION 27 isoform X4 n=1 Tax=Prunus yedoensis var. nudiflora TaxID=2094558 RepID=A0A314XIS3_PRUYE|nr:protein DETOXIFICATION 27 isoform X4 [Prunus yedoensis var. nudiflora]
MGSIDREEAEVDLHQSLLAEPSQAHLPSRVWIESKKLWLVVGPAIVSRLAGYSMGVITQAFAGHLGVVQLASISIANNVVLGFTFGLLRFLQSQLKNFVTLWVSLVVLVFHALISWLFVYVLDFGVVGAAVALDISWWVLCFGLLGHVTCGWCPLSWTGFSMEAFYGLWEFVKLSTASGVMLCLEFWYYRILILMTGYLQNSTLAVDALSICMTINGWELMIHLAFFAGTG